MPNLICDVCGSYFYLSPDHFKYVIPELFNFCSADCLVYYLTTKEPEGHEPSVTFSPVGQFYINHLKYMPEQTLFLRSSFEATVSLLFEYLGLRYYYEKYKLFCRGEIYIPDFYLPDLDLFVEVKGLWKGGSKKKILFWSKYIDIIVIPYYLERSIRKYLSKKS